MIDPVLAASAACLTGGSAIGFIVGKLHAIHTVRSANSTALGEIRRAERLQKRNRELAEHNIKLAEENDRHCQAELLRIDSLKACGAKGRATQIAKAAARKAERAQLTRAALTSAPPAPREQVVAGVRESRKARAAVG